MSIASQPLAVPYTPLTLARDYAELTSLHALTAGAPGIAESRNHLAGIEEAGAAVAAGNSVLSASLIFDNDAEQLLIVNWW